MNNITHKVDKADRISISHAISELLASNLEFNRIRFEGCRGSIITVSRYLSVPGVPMIAICIRDKKDGRWYKCLSINTLLGEQYIRKERMFQNDSSRSIAQLNTACSESG